MIMVTFSGAGVTICSPLLLLMTLPDYCWIMMTTTVMMTPADGFQNNCGTFTNILVDECRRDDDDDDFILFKVQPLG